jgi:voltage-gated potassium channel
MAPGRNYESELLRKDVFRALGFGFALLAYGTAGFRLIEGASLLDSLYMTVITVTTVGFQEVTPASASGKILIFTLLGFGALFGYFMATVIGRAILRNFVLRQNKRMQKHIDRISDHVVLCGHGRIGQIVRQELEQSNKHFVVVESDKKVLRELSQEGILFVEGDATEEETLLEAGVDRAAGVIAAIGSDAGNIFITLTSREHNPHCPIVARAEETSTERKLRMLGATSVVTPYSLGGRRLAQAFLRPGAVDLADLAMGNHGQEVFIEELRLPAEIPAEMTTLKGLALGNRFGLIAVAVRYESDGSLHFNPGAEESLRPKDHLLVMGQREQIDTCQEFLAKC